MKYDNFQVNGMGLNMKKYWKMKVTRIFRIILWYGVKKLMTMMMLYVKKLGK